MLVRELLLVLSCIKLQFGTNKNEFTNVNCKGNFSSYAHRIIYIMTETKILRSVCSIKPHIGARPRLYLVNLALLA